MRPIREFLQLPMTTTRHSGSASAVPSGARCSIPRVDIEQLFLRLSARYQRAWTSLLPSDEAHNVALNEWALILEGVDAQGIERALRRCLVEFPRNPPKPAEFLALTRPSAEELGLPALDAAYRAALAGRWRAHPLVWHAVRIIGQYEFVRMSRDEASRRFREVYERLVEQVARKRQIDPAFELQIPATPPPRLGQDPPRRLTAPGTARAHIASIQKLLKPTGRN